MTDQANWKLVTSARRRSRGFDLSMLLWGAIGVLGFTLMIVCLMNIGAPTIPDGAVTF